MLLLPIAALALLALAVAFVLRRRDDRLAGALAVVAATVVAVGSATWAGTRLYDLYYGPSHPASATPALPVDLVEFTWAGGVTSSGFVVKVLPASPGEPPSLLVSPDPSLTDALEFQPTAPTDPDSSIVTFTVEGLEPDTLYWYTFLAGNAIEAGRAGRVRTFPEGAASFTVAIGACQETGSNGRVFDLIREADPLLFILTGDFHYEDIKTDTPAAFREAIARNLRSPAQQALYLRTPLAYVWDDHDFGGDNSDSGATAAPAAHRVYRDYVPHYPLETGPEGPIYQAWSIGRVRFIMTDTRSHRFPRSEPDGPAKTMLGEEQKAWFKQQLLGANGEYPLIVWVSSVPWIGEPSAGADHWAGYATERSEIADFIAANGIGGLVIVSGDAHMLAIDDGSNSDYASAGGAPIPVLHAAALDRRGSVKGGPYSEGAYPGGGQFALMIVEDRGEAIRVTWSGRNWRGEEVVAYSFEVPSR